MAASRNPYFAKTREVKICIASELASEKNGWQVNFAECVFLIITMEKYVS